MSRKRIMVLDPRRKVTTTGSWPTNALRRHSRPAGITIAMFSARLLVTATVGYSSTRLLIPWFGCGEGMRCLEICPNLPAGALADGDSPGLGSTLFPSHGSGVALFGFSSRASAFWRFPGGLALGYSFSRFPCPDFISMIGFFLVLILLAHMLF